MDNEGKFWFSIWSTVICGVLMLCVIGAYSSHLKDEKLLEMVKRGADPLRAKCGLMSSESSRNNTVCVSLANAK